MEPRIPASRPAGARSAVFRLPSPLAEILALLIIAAIAIVGVLIFIPLLILAAIALLIFIAVAWVRLKFRRAKAPNGPLDGRHNVRVINRDE